MSTIVKTAMTMVALSVMMEVVQSRQAIFADFIIL